MVKKKMKYNLVNTSQSPLTFFLTRLKIRKINDNELILKGFLWLTCSDRWKKNRL
ncbi:Uncharacterized protein dnm_062490 [Desulfonema magnum]|uniref:Uncharacterized protein n=1 Tax=Desulfonema magnum TaxID=45655 RepID=A0A975BRD6_9BACT|nr:Uncharacterized protein dnm_062490 [Desulfonema magnum]